MYNKLNRMILAAALVLVTVGMAQAINIDMVPVGNSGNAPDTLVMNDGTTGYGSVGYSYSISKCEITAGQYTEFLNAVAGASDPYGLYNNIMGIGIYGSTITKSGSIYTAVLPNEPALYISWSNAARFCNWMQTGTTENGAYTLGGHIDASYLSTVTRNPGATYVIPSENEWYKAAYYDPNKVAPGVGGYWLYPTKSNDYPGNTYPSSSANNANYRYATPNGNYTLGVTPWTTEVGSFANSLSAYGTLDQGGNVWEWNEKIFYPQYSTRGLRGGGFTEPSSTLAASFRNADSPTIHAANYGFRIAVVPEPGSIILLACGAIAGLICWIRRR
jgi:formylglycine-generating enzyme